MAYQPKSYRKFLAGSVSAALVATAVGPVVASAASFSDVNPNDAHAANISALVEKGYIKGFEDGTFKPYNNVTRGQVAKIFARILKDAGVQVPADKKAFDDVPVDSKDQELVEAAAIVKAAGVMTGSNGKLNPAANMTREQMAKVLVEAFDLTKPADFTSKITDLDKADASFRDYIQTLEANGVTVVTEYNPKGTVTRAAFASFVKRAMDASASVELKIESVTALNDTNQYLKIDFSRPVSNLEPSNIVIKDAKKGDVYGVKAVTLSADRKSATVELYQAKEDENVLQENTEYTVTVTVDGKKLTSTFYDAAFMEARVIDINVGDDEFVIADDDDGTKKTIEVPKGVEFDYQAALGELVRVWYNDDNELVKYEIVNASAAYDAIEITETDEIKLLSTGKKYDISDEEYDDSDKKKFKIYINGKDVTTKDGEIPSALVDKKINFAKVGFDKSGNVEYISAYTLNNFLIVDKVEGDEVVGVEGEGTGGSFDASDATVVKDGKVISLSDLQKGDILFFNDKADDDDGYAVVYNKTVTGAIDEVYDDAVEVGGKTYKFIADDDIVNDFSYSYDGDSADFEYGNAVYINEDGKTEYIDSDAAEELQAAGEVTLYLDPAGNLVYIAGETAAVDSKKLSAIITDPVEYDSKYGDDYIKVEAVLENGKQITKEINLADLDKVKFNGTEYDLDDYDAKVVDVSGKKYLKIYPETNLKTPVSGAEFNLTDAEGSLVKFHFDDSDNVTQIEFFTSPTAKEGLKTSTSTVEAGDSYIDGKKLTSDTVVFDATDDYTKTTGTDDVYDDLDPDNVTVTKWGDYKGSDFDRATFIYNDDNEVVALVINHTTANDTTDEGAVVTKVLKNTDGEVVSIDAYVNGQLQTFKVDKVKKSLAKGDVAHLVFDDNNPDLVKDFTVDDSHYVVKDLIVRSVDVGKREVTFVNGKTYKLVSGGLVLDGTDVSDITVETLSDLRDPNIKVTVVLDEADSDYFAQFFVFKTITASEYNSLKLDQNRAPVAKSGLNQTVNEGAANLTFTASDLATDADGNTLSLVSASSDNANAATATISNGQLVVDVADDVTGSATATATITVRVSDGLETTDVTFTVTVNNTNNN